MLNWLRPTPPRVPPYATHQVGVGGAVFNERGEVLAIRERHAVVEGYKLPGGLSEPGEDISAAIEREVREETGVQAAFESVVSFRQQHHVAFDISDLYIVCRLRALTTEIHVCEEEIAEACWLPLETLAQQTNPMVAMAMRILQSQLRDKPADAASRIVRSADEIAGQTALLPVEMAQVTMPSVVYTDRTFHYYVSGAAVGNGVKLRAKDYATVKRIPNSDDHVM